MCQEQLGGNLSLLPWIPHPIPRDLSGCFSSLGKFPQLVLGWGSIPGQPEEFISESVVGYIRNVQLTLTWNFLLLAPGKLFSLVASALEVMAQSAG